MKKQLLLLSAVFVFIFSAFTLATSVWKNDKAHSEITFTVKHLGISEVSGHFNDFDVTVEADSLDLSTAKFTFAARTNSLDTRVEARNNHLKSADFLDAEKFPEIKFTSNSVKSVGGDNYILHGNLNMHGVNRPVQMYLKYMGKTVNVMSGKSTMGFQMTGMLKRSDFNIGAGFPPPMVSDEVYVKADGEFILQ